MRGKQWRDLYDTDSLRITPAHAGKTAVPFALDDPFEDHPRACGENALKTKDLISSKGSPPRMRGKLARVRPILFQARITPAHAGKTKIAAHNSV